MRLGIRRRDVEVVPEGARKCRDCGAVKPLEAFREIRCKDKPRHRLSMCRLCENRSDRQRYRGERPKRKRKPSKPAPSTPLQRAIWLRNMYRCRRKKIDARIAEVEREIARIRGDVA